LIGEYFGVKQEPATIERREIGFRCKSEVNERA
jgi:hypothetical protein